MPVFGLHALNTTIAALDAGITYRPDGDGPPFWAGVLSGEIGVAGIQGSVGIGHYWPPRTDWGGPGAELSLRVQGSILRTWGGPFHVEPDQSFAGLEVQGMFMLVGIRIGYFRRIAGAATGDESFVGAGVVIGWQ
jgi:hypothetical protein